VEVVAHRAGCDDQRHPGGAVARLARLVVVVAAGGRSSGTILFELTTATAITAIAFGTILGAVAGFVPALHAARLDPVEALRHE
jgi:ABC-type antimicrobial peptide transport system permease subunit